MAESEGALGWLGRAEAVVEFLAGVLALAASAAIVLGIVLRNGFDVSPSWIVEAPAYAITWAVFLVLGGTFRRGLHLGLDIVVAKLPLGIQHALGIFASLATAAIAAVLVWIGADLTLRQFSMGAISNTALRMPLFIVTAAVPVGCAMLFAHSIADIAQRLREGPQPPVVVAEPGV